MIGYKIQDVITVKDFYPVISLEMSEEEEFRDTLINGYVVTKEIKDIFISILQTITGFKSPLPLNQRCRSHYIIAEYGKGKSYFLTILAMIVDSLKDEVAFSKFHQLFDKFTEVQEQLEKVKGKCFIPVRIVASDKSSLQFKYMVLKALKEEIEKRFGEIPPEILSTEFDIALKHLENLEIEKKEVFGLFESSIINLGFSVEELKDKLKEYKREALEVYYKAFSHTFGRDPDPFEEADFSKIFKEISAFVRSEGYEGIIFFVDELTTYLSASIESNRLHTDLADIQTMAETFNDRRNHFWIIGAMHEELEDILKDKVREDQFEKVKGRFETHSFITFEFNKLVSGLMSVNKDFLGIEIRPIISQYHRINNLVKEYNWEGTALDFYPIHPNVIHVLPRISSRFAQQERTAFTFINTELNKILEEPVVKDNRMNLITIDKLFDYFVESFAKKEPEIIQACNSLYSLCEDEIDLKIVKALAVLNLTTRIPPIGEELIESKIEPDKLAIFLNYDEERIKTCLERLAKSEYIYFEIEDGKRFYHFSVTKLPKVDELIKKEILKVDAKSVFLGEMMKPLERKNIFRLGKFDLDLKVNRTFKVDLLTLHDLKNKEELKPEPNYDAWIIYVIPDFITEFDKKTVYKEVKNLVRDNIIIAVPNDVNMVSKEKLKEFGAINSLINKTKDEKEKMALEKKRSILVGGLDEMVDNFCNMGNFIFITSYGEKTIFDGNIQYKNDLKSVLEFVMDNYYNKFPKIRAERIHSRRVTNELIRDIIDQKERTFSESSTKESERQIRDTMEPLGLVKIAKAETPGYLRAELSTPKEGVPKEIWDIIDNNIEKSITKVYQILESRPYGLPNFLIELFIATYLKMELACVYDKKGRVTKSLEKLVNYVTDKKDKEYKIVKVETLDENTKYYLKGIWKLIQKGDHHKKITEAPCKIEEQDEIWKILKVDLTKLNIKIMDYVRLVSTFLDGITLESINELKKFHKLVEETIAIAEPSIAFTKLKEIPIHFIKQENPSLRDCYYKFNELISICDKLEGFSKEFDKISSIIEKNNELLIPKEFENINNERQKFSEFLAANKEEVVIDAKKRIELFDVFSDFWLSYVAEYEREHSRVSELRKNFGKELIESKKFRLLKTLSNLKFLGIMRSQRIEIEIRDIRDKFCNFKPMEKIRNIDSNLLYCPKCNYKLGEIKKIEDEIKAKKKDAEINVDKAVQGYFNSILENKDKLNLFLEEKKEFEKLEKFQKLVEILKQGMREVLKEFDAVNEVLIDLIGDINDCIVEEKEIKQIPFEDFIRHVKRQGKTIITLSELLDIFKEWFSEIQEEHGEDIKISIGDSK